VCDNRFNEAIDLLHRAMMRHPAIADFLYRIACYHYDEKNFSKAYSVFKEAIALDFKKHHQAFDYMPEMKKDSVIVSLIEIHTEF
jgi:tetratricopeptide (TPR) repeat protein